MIRKNKKRIAVAGILIFLCILTVGGWHIYRESQRFTTIPASPNPSIDDVVWMGIGTVDEEDTCLVIENAASRNHYVEFKVMPGKYVFFTEVEGKMEELEGDIDQPYREKFYWYRIQTNIYDIASGRQVRSIDVKQLIEEQAPGYQYDGWGEQVFSGENGHVFLDWILSDIPEDGNQEKVSKDLCMDYETGEIYLVDAPSELCDDDEKQEKFKTEFYNNGWGGFMEKNGFTKSWEKGEKSFDYGTYDFVNGIANIDVEASELPKENKALYTRFPGLQKYQGEAGKVVRVFLGGYPTAEEMQQLFTEEASE